MKTILLTPGDPSGIGPEVTKKALKLFRSREIQFVIVGAEKPFLEYRFHSNVSFVATPTKAPKGKHLGGFQSGWAIEKSVSALCDLQRKKKSCALVTGPISKLHLQKGGYPFSGHTDFLAHLSKTKSVTMCLANSTMRVMLATVHIPLKTVSQKLTFKELERTFTQTAEFLLKQEKIRAPRIGVCGLNPHAGEDGVLGNEEARLIAPAVRQASLRFKGKVQFEGPFPADTLFFRKGFDAFVAMYHDQGLIPVKLVDFQNSVNLTLGLPFVRTSVDHGTAFDIAGKGIADPSSMIAAIRKAIDLA